MISRRIPILLLALLPISLLAQRDAGGRFEEGFFWGFKAGVTSSTVNDLRTTLIAPIYPVETYQTQDNTRLGGLGAFFIDYRHSSKSYIVGRFEIGYAMQGGRFNYTDVDGLEYELAMNYDYLTLAPMVKINIPPGLPYIIAGCQIGVNLTSETLNYTSNDDAFIDLQVQESLRTVLKGRANTALTAGIGFELTRSGFYIEGRYTHGLTDVVETQANNFLFIENKNTSNYYQLTLGMPVPFQ
ncbi:MAG: hypothetical protein AAFY48_14135 [Bacteroidota bacterium]